MAAAVDHAAKAVAAADRPIHRPAGEPQFLLDLIDQLEGLPAGPVHLVDEGEDRDPPHPADLEQFAGLGFQALRGVLEHHRVVGRGEGAVGVLGEVLVAGGVEQVDRAAAVVELQHGGGDRDAALLLQLHPVGGDLALLPLGLHGARLLDRAPVEQQFLGERGLAGVGVGNDREVAAAGHRLRQGGALRVGWASRGADGRGHWRIGAHGLQPASRREPADRWISSRFPGPAGGC